LIDGLSFQKLAILAQTRDLLPFGFTENGSQKFFNVRSRDRATALEHIFSIIRAQSSFSVFVKRVSRSLSVVVTSYLEFVIMFRVRVSCFVVRARFSSFSGIPIRISVNRGIGITIDDEKSRKGFPALLA